MKIIRKILAGIPLIVILPLYFLFGGLYMILLDVRSKLLEWADVEKESRVESSKE